MPLLRMSAWTATLTRAVGLNQTRTLQYANTEQFDMLELSMCSRCTTGNRFEPSLASCVRPPNTLDTVSHWKQQELAVHVCCTPCPLSINHTALPGVHDCKNGYNCLHGTACLYPRCRWRLPFCCRPLKAVPPSPSCLCCTSSDSRSQTLSGCHQTARRLAGGLHMAAALLLRAL